MIKKLYAVLDNQVNHFMNPIHCINHGDAIRLFTNWVNPEEGEQPTNMSKYPAHFSLWYMGDFDDQTGRLGQLDEQTQEFKDRNTPKELIAGTSVRQEAETKFTVKQLMTMIEMELKNRNIIDISNSAAGE